MTWYIIVIVALAGFAAGFAAVYLLIRSGVSRLVSFAPIAALVVLAPLAWDNPWWYLAGFAIACAGVAAGWMVASYALFRRPDRSTAPVAPIVPGAPRRVAVVYFTHGEPETYEPEPWVNMLFELDDTVPGFPPKPVWPFILGGIKTSFSAVCESPHCRIHGVTMDAVRHKVGREDLVWYLSFLDADPPLRRMVAQAAADGATDIVFLTVFLTDSDHTAEADGMDKAMGLSAAGIRSIRTPVLWDEPRLARMIADKVITAAGDRERASVGVMLVGHGQPEQWDETHPTETQQEQEFRQKVRGLLGDDGFLPVLVSDAWMSFREPKVPARVRELATRGARSVIGVPLTISADSLHSLHDTPRLVRKGARGTALEVIDVGGWNTEPLLVEILADRVEAALGDLETQPSPADRASGASGARRSASSSN